MFEKVEPVTQEEQDVLYTSEIQECNQHLIDEHVKLIKEKLSTATKDESNTITHMIEGTELEFQVRKVFEKAGYIAVSIPVKGDEGKSLYSLSIWSQVE